MKKSATKNIIFCVLFILCVAVICGVIVYIIFSNKDENTPPTSPTVCTVTFDSCGGKEIESITVNVGETIERPVPTRDNYDFMGWYIDISYTEKFDFDTPITEDITLYAKWSDDLSELYDFVFSTDFTSYGIAGYNGESSDIILPSEYKELDVVFINTNAFKDNQFIVNLTISDPIKYIYDSAFEDCVNLISIEISDSVVSIGESAFAGCTSLSELVLPESITTIGEKAFSYCYSLKDVQILGDITYFGNSAFYDCQGIEIIYFASTTTGDYQSDGDNYIFYNAGISGNGITLTLTADAVIPTGLFVPNQNSNYPKITTIFFKDETASISSTEFNRMPYLTSITVPDSVRYIEVGIFDETPWYQAQPDGVVYIDNIVYGYKGSLSSNVVIADNVVAFGNPIFSGVSGSMESLTLPFVGMSVDATGKDAVFGSIFGETEYSNGTPIQQQYNTSEFAIFYITSSLEAVIINGENIGNYAFHGCENLTKVTIGEEVTNIGNYAFYECAKLTEITIPNSVISIGISAFYRCTNLKTATINSGSISNYAFYNCTSLTELTIGEGVTYIGVSVFYNSTALTNIKFNARNCEDLINGNYAFNNAGRSTEGITVIFGDSVEKIPNYLFCPYGSSEALNIAKILMGNNITSIGNFAFAYCTGFTEITIPDSVTSIGNSAFRNCTNLTKVTIGEKVANIGNYSFYNCTNLTEITIPNSVISIGSSTFRSCTNLTEVVIESEYVYDNLSSETSSCGYLGEYATTIKVLATIVENNSSNTYLNNDENFTKSQDGEYYVYEKVVGD